MASMIKMYWQGVSTRKASRIIKTLCGTVKSKSYNIGVIVRSMRIMSI